MSHKAVIVPIHNKESIIFANLMVQLVGVITVVKSIPVPKSASSTKSTPTVVLRIHSSNSGRYYHVSLFSA